MLCFTIYRCIVACDLCPSLRKNAFTQLYPLLLENARPASYYIGKAFVPMVFEKLPLVKFCIKKFSDICMRETPDLATRAQKDAMVSFKNSLLIMKHFQSIDKLADTKGIVKD